MKTAKIFAIAIFILTCFQLQAQKSCPRNFDGNSFLSIKNKMRKHVSETIAFDAEVVEVGEGYNDIPYFRVKFENGEEVWIASMVSNKYIKEKAKLRLLGYIDLVKRDDAIALKYNKDGYQIRVFALLDHLSKQMQMSNAFDEEAKDWVAGKIPKNRR